MSVVRLSVDSQSCATPHCSRESVWASGPYAGLCNVCAATSRHRRARAAATRMTTDERRAQRREALRDRVARAIHAFDCAGRSEFDDLEPGEQTFYVQRADAAIDAMGWGTNDG